MHKGSECLNFCKKSLKSPSTPNAVFMRILEDKTKVELQKKAINHEKRTKKSVDVCTQFEKIVKSA